MMTKHLKRVIIISILANVYRFLDSGNVLNVWELYQQCQEFFAVKINTLR